VARTYAGFEDHLLNDGHHFFVGRLPEALCPDRAAPGTVFVMPYDTNRA
jgi:hypothetical protein